MGRAKRTNCRLCSKATNRNDSTTLNNLPKTFAHILEEMSGIRFTQADGLHITVCNQCRDFLQAMEHHSSYPGSNKISGAGRKKVRRLMDKGFSAQEAIDKVAAEKRARDLLAGVMSQGVVNDLQQQRTVQNVLNIIPEEKRRMSGAQRRKVQLLMVGGMDKIQARELVLTASNQIVAALQPLMGENAIQAGPNQGGNAQRRPRQSGGSQNAPRQQGVNRQIAAKQNAPSRRGPANVTGPQKGTQQKGQARRVAPAKNAPQKATTNGAVKKPPVKNAQAQNTQPQKAQAKNAPVLKGQAQKPIASTNPQQRRANNSNPSGVKTVNPDRTGPKVAARRNERPAPYNNRGNAQQQRNQNSARPQNGNFNNNQSPCPVEVGIIPINFPNVQLDSMKLDALKEAITNEIFKIPQGGPAIRFLGTSSQNGWLKVICADQLSYNWLGMLVSRWERAGVRMVEGNDLPHSVYLSFFLPGDFRSPQEILSILERQNNGLNTNNWRILNRDTDESGQRIIVSVDEQNFQALQSRDFTVFLGLGVVEMKASQENPCGGSFNNAPMQGNNNNSYNYRSNSGGGGGGGMGNNYQAKRQNNSGGGGGGNGGPSYQRQGMGQGYQRGGYQNQRVW